MGNRVICDLFHRFLDLISNKLIFYRQRFSSKFLRQRQVFTDLRKCVCSSVYRQRPLWGSRHSFAWNSNKKSCGKQTSWIIIYDRSEVCNACIKRENIHTGNWLWLKKGPSESGTGGDSSSGDGMAQAVVCQGQRSTVVSPSMSWWLAWATPVLFHHLHFNYLLSWRQEKLSLLCGCPWRSQGAAQGMC